MKVTLRLFSVARELAGFREQSMELPAGSRADHVLEILERSNPAFGGWKHSIRIAVNQEYVPNNHLLREGDDVAVIPPVSGG
jgi:molybdopterin synthase catalytic subunit